MLMPLAIGLLCLLPLLCGLIPILLVSVVPSVLLCQGCGPSFTVENGGWTPYLPMFLFLCEAQPFIPGYRNLPSLDLSLAPALTPTLLALETSDLV